MFIQCVRNHHTTQYYLLLLGDSGVMFCSMLHTMLLILHFNTCFLLSFGRSSSHYNVFIGLIPSLQWCEIYIFSVQLRGPDCVIHLLAVAASTSSNENLCSICVWISVKLMFAQFDVIVFIGRFSKYCAIAENRRSGGKEN